MDGEEALRPAVVEEPQDKTERYLVQLYHQDAGLFHPSQRNTKGREDIRNHLGLSDEQIEGWYIMLLRNVIYPHLAKKRIDFEQI